MINRVYQLQRKLQIAPDSTTYASIEIISGAEREKWVHQPVGSIDKMTHTYHVLMQILAKEKRCEMLTRAIIAKKVSIGTYRFQFQVKIHETNELPTNRQVGTFAKLLTNRFSCNLMQMLATAWSSSLK